MKASRKNRAPVSDEAKAKMSASAIASRKRPEIAEKFRGRVHSVETRKKISLSLSGRPLAEETKAKIGIANTGRRHSKKTIEKMRISAIKREADKNLRNQPAIK